MLQFTLSLVLMAAALGTSGPAVKAKTAAVPDKTQPALISCSHCNLPGCVCTWGCPYNPTICFSYCDCSGGVAPNKTTKKACVPPVRTDKPIIYGRYE